MKKTTWAIIALLILASCGNDPLTINTDTFNLNGNVKSVTENLIYSIYDDDWNTEIDTNIIHPSIITTYFFNDKGDWISSETKLSTGEALTKEEVTFSESGDYTGSKVYLDNDELYYENKVVEFTKDVRETDSYDKSNNKIATIRTEYENGRPVFVKAEYITPEMKIETRYKYNEYGDEIESTRVTESDGVEKKETILVKYTDRDKQDNWLRQITYNPKSNDNKCVVFEREIVYY